MVAGSQMPSPACHKVHFDLTKDRTLHSGKDRSLFQHVGAPGLRAHTIVQRLARSLQLSCSSSRMTWEYWMFGFWAGLSHLCAMESAALAPEAFPSSTSAPAEQ